MVELMNNQSHIRNISIIPGVDFGKTTLTSFLNTTAGIVIPNSEEERYYGTHERQVYYTIKPVVYPLYFERGDQYLIQLMDSLVNIESSYEVEAALRVIDGVLVVVDCVEGRTVRVELMLRQALQQRVKPVLMLNKLDRFFLELQLDSEHAYQSLKSIVESINLVISTCQDDSLPDFVLHPDKGSVVFGSGLHCWYFTITKFAEFYSKKFKIPVNKLAKKLWGDHYYDVDGKKWTNVPTGTSNRPLKRGFCQFILDPISMVINNCLNDQHEKVEKMLSSLGIELTNEDKELRGKEFMKTVMGKFLGGNALLEMIVLHLPSPVMAQSYRYSGLYTGPLDDKYATAIKNCDPQGPLMMYISELVPTNLNKSFAFGRVFSGTIRTGQKCRIMGPKYIAGRREDLYIEQIQRTVIMTRTPNALDSDVPCGNVVGLLGISDFIVKTATLTDSECEDACPLKNMKYSESLVVKVTISPKSPRHLPLLIEGLKKLARFDSFAQVFMEESTGEHVISGTGELHIEYCLKYLQDHYIDNTIVNVSRPIVSYRETVLAESSMDCISKSPNKHNRLYMRACPISEELCLEIEDNPKTSSLSSNLLAKKFSEDYGWNKSEAMKIWAFGPESNGSNIIVDQSKGIQYLNEIQDAVVGAFQWMTKEGLLTEGILRGVRFNLIDAVLHSDAIHRGAGQIMPTARRNMYAAQYTADPRLLEPVYLVEIQTPQDYLSPIHDLLSRRRGYIISEVQITKTYNGKSFNYQNNLTNLFSI
jgi:elongation factor 2